MRALLIGTLALAACTQGVGDAPAAPAKPLAPITGPCDTNKIQDLIGKPAAMVGADAKARSGAKIVRTYVLGSMLTLDYNSNRLNVGTDAGGTIVKLSCG